MTSQYRDENGVFTNLLGHVDAAALRETEYELTFLRAAELTKNSDVIAVDGFGLDRLQAIHQYLFKGVYPWAGLLRTVPLSRRAESRLLTHFVAPDAIASRWIQLQTKCEVFASQRGGSAAGKIETLCEIFVEANKIHPFVEGNGRALRIFLEQLAKRRQITLDFSAVDPDAWNHASALASDHGRMFEKTHFVAAPSDTRPIATIFRGMAAPIKEHGR